MPKVYLAGAIWGIKDPHTWRREVAAQLPEGWEAVNPLDLNDGVFKEGDDPELIVEKDFEAIMACDVVLARVDMPSWGTGMEIRFAKEWCIPVIGWTVGPYARPVSPWVQVHCVMITPHLPTVFECLKNQSWTVDA